MTAVSIIIPMFNSKNIIAACLTSIIRQTIIENIEIICVADGSTDGTPEYVKNLYNKIIVLYEEKNGAGIARNKG